MHPLRCKPFKPEIPMKVDKNALMQIEYVTPFYLELVAKLPAQDQQPEGLAVIASMELIPSTLSYLLELFGDDLANDQGQSSFTECVANIVNVYADIDQSIFSLDVVNWSQLE